MQEKAYPVIMSSNLEGNNLMTKPHSHILEGMEYANNEPPTRYSLALSERDAYILPPNIFILRVEHGGAWVSYRGEDRILYSGQKMRFFGDSHTAVITSIGAQPARLEIIRA
jgi:hypothetical protein